MRPVAMPHPASDASVAMVASLAVGCGLVLAVAGGAAGSLSWLVFGGGVVAAGAATLVAGGWLEGTALVALSVPLPALASGGGLRVAGAAPVAAVVLVGWVGGFTLPRGRLDTAHAPMVALLLLMASWLLAALFSATSLVAARETLNFFLLIALLLAAADAFRARPRAREEAVTILALLAALCGALAVLETVGILPAAFPRPGTSLNRAALGFGQPNGLGLFLALSVPLVVHRRGTARGGARLAWSLALLSTVAGLVGTFSRGAWLAVLLGAGALAFVGHGRQVLRIWSVALLLAAVADVASGGAIRDTVERTAGDWVLEQRAALAATGLVMYADHPVVGVGPGGFAERLDEYGALVTTLVDLQPTPHNAYVQAAAETGTLGLMAFLGVLAAAGLRLLALARSAARRSRAAGDAAEERIGPAAMEDSLRRAVLWSMATVAVAGLVIWPLAHGYGEAVALILAVGLAAKDGSEEVAP